jgi:hypothetical protein
MILLRVVVIPQLQLLPPPSHADFDIVVTEI